MPIACDRARLLQGSIWLLIVLSGAMLNLTSVSFASKFPYYCSLGNTLETRGAVPINMDSEAYSPGDIKNGTETGVQETSLRDGDVLLAGASVEAKYMGTITDQHEMSMLGRAQALRVRIPHKELFGTTH